MMSRRDLPGGAHPAGSSPLYPSGLAIDRRGFLKAAGVTAAGAALAACGGGTSAPGPHGSGAVQLVYQDWRTDWFPKMAQDMLAVFHESHPNIEVFYTPDPENVEERMLPDFQSGTAPDVFQGCCDWFAIWAQQGYLLDLRPFVEADLDRSVIDEWDAAQYAALFTPEGLQFGLPKYHGALALYYNKDLFDQQDVDYPDNTWTHDDYLQAMKQLTQDTDGDGQPEIWGSMLDISWERLQVHVNAWGGHFVDPDDPTKSWMARPEALAALEWIRERMWEDRVMASFLDVDNMETRQAFYQGRLAMVEDGSWALRDILDNADFRIGVASFPTGPVRKTTLSTTDGFGIYAGTKYPEAAWELLKFLISKEYGRAMARANFLQPARASLVDEWAQIVLEEYPEKARGIDLTVFALGQQAGNSVTAEIFANMEDARQLTREAWQRIFTLGQAPVDDMVQVSAFIELAQEHNP
jgi:multiple sugar transport system substrate-binding protein